MKFKTGNLVIDGQNRCFLILGTSIDKNETKFHNSDSYTSVEFKNYYITMSDVGILAVLVHDMDKVGELLA